MKILKGSQGIALVVVIMVMVILLSITGASLLFSTLNLKTASNLKSAGGAIHVADAGIQHALALIPSGTEFDALLTGSVTGFPCASPCNGVTNKPALTGSLSGYTYKVEAENDSESGGPTNDSNKVVILTSTATGPNNSSKRKIKAYIGRSTSSWVPPGAIYLPSTVSQSEWDLAGNFLVTGKDTNYDSAVGPSAAIPGIAPTSTAVKNNIVSSLTAASKLNNVQGLSYSPGPPIVPSVSTTNTQIDVNQIAQGFIDAASPTNKYPNGLTRSANDCPNPPSLQPPTCIFGTDLAPKITYINDGASLYGTVTGSGVLIVKGRVVLGENFNFHGLVIHLLPATQPADAVLEFTMEGNAKIYGSLILGPQGEELEFTMKSNSKLYYSSQAITMLRNTWASLLPQPARLIAWNEVMQ